MSADDFETVEENTQEAKKEGVESTWITTYKVYDSEREKATAGNRRHRQKPIKP